MHQKKVLFITSSLGLGGLETYLINCISRLDTKLIAPLVLCEGRGRDHYGDTLRSMGVPVYYCRFTPFIAPFLLKLRRIIKYENVDVVCDFRGDMSGPTLLCAFLMGVNVRIAMYRNAARVYRMTPVRAKITRYFHSLVLKYATKITGNSDAVVNYFFSDCRTDTRLSILHNGVDIDRFAKHYPRPDFFAQLGINDNDVLITHVGRLIEQKNHEYIIDVARTLKDRNLNVKFLLIGEGPNRFMLEEKCRLLDLTDVVLFGGIKNNIPAILNNSDLFLFPSFHEGMPNALIEAMAAGLCFIASDIDEIKEIVPSELQYLLVDNSDANTCVELISHLISCPGERRQISSMSEIWVRTHFSIEKAVSDFCKLF